MRATSSIRPLIALVCLAALLGASRTLGQVIWTGAGTDQNFTTAGNWSGGNVPPNTGADSALFQQSAYNNIYVNTPANLSGLTFSSTGYPDYYLYSSSGGTLTIGSGGIATTGGGSAYIILDAPIILSASQTWGTSLGYIESFGGISDTGGAASLTTNGGVYLFGTNTFSGGLTVASGFLYLGSASAAGTGTLTLSNNTSVQGNSVTIPNPVSLGTNVTLGQYAGSSPLTFSGAVTAVNAATTLNVGYSATVVLTGSLTGPASPLSLSIGGDTSRLPDDGGSLLVMEGNLSNVASVSVSYSSLILAPAMAPGTAFASLLATGQLQVGDNAYLGLDGMFTTGGTVSGFLAAFGPTLGPAIYGTLGFDTFANPSSPNLFSDPIDLGNFTSANFQGLGSVTAAILTSSAVITPPTSGPHPNTYLFGGGGGTLTVQSALTDNVSGPTPRSLVMNASDEPLTVILQSTGNSYSGGTTSNGGVLIFDSPTPATGSISLEGGYVGYTSKATNITTAQTFVGLFGTGSANGVIGFDTVSGDTTPVPISDPISLAAFTGSNPFLGTSTTATLAGSITPASNTYQFTGVKGGQLTVNSTLSDPILSGSNSVVVGLPNPIEANQSVSAVTLGGTNTYSGGTTLNNGVLYVTNPSSLGTGALTVQNYNTTTLAPLGASVALNNPITVNNYFILGQSGNTNTLTLNGIISGNGELNIESDVGLNGLNTFLGGVYIYNSNVTLGSASALGGGSVYLQNSALTVNTPSLTLLDLAGSDSGEIPLAVNLAPGSTLTLNTNSNYTSYAAFYSGAINGDTSNQVIKTGTGIQQLAGTSTYGGGTTVSAGALVASGSASLGTGTVSVQSGAELEVSNSATLTNALSLAPGSTVGGTGAFAPASGVAIANGSIVRPGHTLSDYASEQFVGTLSFSSVTLGGGGIYDFDIQNAGGVAGTNYSTLNVSGALTLSATQGSPFQITLTSINPSTGTPGPATFDPTLAYSWTLVSAGSITGFDPTAFTFNTSGFQNPLGTGNFFVSENGNALDLNFTPVPEPSTWVLMLTGAAALGARLRRSKRS